jgi:hypothetical protein
LGYLRAALPMIEKDGWTNQHEEPPEFYSELRAPLGSSAKRRPGTNSQDGFGKRPGRLVRQGMACLDCAVLVTPDEHAGVIGSAAGLQWIFGAVE